MKNLFASKLVRNIGSIGLSLLMLGFGFNFLRQEGVNLPHLGKALSEVPSRWFYLGLLLSAAYVWIHGEMYRQSFRTLGLPVSTWNMVRLFLKRNLLSVFLPAGYLSSQAFFSKEIERLEQVEERQVLAASGIFASSGLLSMLLLGIPALAYLFSQHLFPQGATEAFAAISLLLLGVFWALWSMIKKGRVYRWSEKHFPAFFSFFDIFHQSEFKIRYFIQTILWSCGIEVLGFLHVLIATRAFGAELNLTMALAGYTAVLLVLFTSPFLRGVGAVEALLSMVLVHFGMQAVPALSAAILFRFFEFWVVLLMAIPVFLFKPNNLFIRLAPAVLLFLLGVISILSGLTPAIPERVKLLGAYLPIQAMHASLALTLGFGFLLLLTAYYLYQGLRSAWVLALLLSMVAFVSHLGKGFDYEEAALALTSISVLLAQKKEYKLRSDFRWMQRRWIPAILVILTINFLIAVGFYLLDHRHFGADFTWVQSLNYAVEGFLLMDIPSLHALTVFGAEFLGMTHLLGGLTLLLLVYTIFRPLLPYFEPLDAAREKAMDLVKHYGNSPLDYFKTYPDKKLYFTENGQAFLSYKNTRRYAMVLENPVAADETAIQNSIQEFDHFCDQNGLSSIYYRVPSASVPLYRALGKSLLPLGQEARVNLDTFSLEGKQYKALRNAVNKMEREGYTFVVHAAPQHNAFLQQLKQVSDEWLQLYDRAEINFSQGVFDENELRHQTILTIENTNGKIEGFINLIPGANASEANFDLMRRTRNAPGGAMDYMFVKMFQYLKAQGFRTCNLGLVPMSGLQNPGTMPERLINLAYQNLPQFADYKALRFYKEKFNPEWETKYVAFDHQLDLMHLPLVLKRVIRA